MLANMIQTVYHIYIYKYLSLSISYINNIVYIVYIYLCVSCAKNENKQWLPGMHMQAKGRPWYIVFFLKNIYILFMYIYTYVCV